MVDIDATALFLVDVNQTALFEPVDVLQHVDVGRRPFYSPFPHARLKRLLAKFKVEDDRTLG